MTILEFFFLLVLLFKWGCERKQKLAEEIEDCQIDLDRIRK